MSGEETYYPPGSILLLILEPPWTLEHSQQDVEGDWFQYQARDTGRYIAAGLCDLSEHPMCVATRHTDIVFVEYLLLHAATLATSVTKFKPWALIPLSLFQDAAAEVKLDKTHCVTTPLQPLGTRLPKISPSQSRIIVDDTAHFQDY